MIQVNDITHEVLRLAEHDLQVGDISVITEYQENLPQIHADHTQIQQVILNLVKNAIDAMRHDSPNKRQLRFDHRLRRKFNCFASYPRLRVWNSRRGPKSHIRSVFYNETYRYGTGALHLSNYGRGPRRQIAPVLQVNACAKPVIARRPISGGLDRADGPRGRTPHWKN
jgi:hypothetical protein